MKNLVLIWSTKLHMAAIQLGSIVMPKEKLLSLESRCGCTEYQYPIHKLSSFHLQCPTHKSAKRSVCDMKKMEKKKEVQKSKKESWSGEQFREMR